MWCSGVNDLCRMPAVTQSAMVAAPVTGRTLTRRAGIGVSRPQGPDAGGRAAVGRPPRRCQFSLVGGRHGRPLGARAGTRHGADGVCGVPFSMTPCVNDPLSWGLGARAAPARLWLPRGPVRPQCREASLGGVPVQHRPRPRSLRPARRLSDLGASARRLAAAAIWAARPSRASEQLAQGLRSPRQSKAPRGGRGLPVAL